MSIFAVNYLKAFFPKPDITITLDIYTYDYLHHMQLELKTNALSVHLNLGGATHGHLELLLTNTKFATLSNDLYLGPVHPNIY